MRALIAMMPLLVTFSPAAAECNDPINFSIELIELKAPSEAASFDVVNEKGEPVAEILKPPAPVITAGKLTIAGDYRVALKILRQMTAIRLRWKKADGSNLCEQPFAMEASPAAGSDPPPGDQPKRVSLQECMDAGKKWADEISKGRAVKGGRIDFTTVVFSDSGAVCHVNRDYGISGDPIYVGLVTQNDAVKGLSVSFTPCELEQESPSVRVESGLESFDVQTGKDAPVVSPLYEGRTCYNRDVTVEVVVALTGKPAPETWRHAIRQHVRYRATADIGILSTDLHEHEYALIDDGTGTQVVFDKGPVEDGPEWYVNVVIYGIPHYLKDLGGKSRYQGRDILHDQRFSDRLGLFFGISLDEPTKRVSAGLSFELLAGVNLLAGYERARTSQLVGLSSGDPYPGTIENLPIQERWDGDFRWGVALDLRYLTALFQRK